MNANQVSSNLYEDLIEAINDGDENTIKDLFDENAVELFGDYYEYVDIGDNLISENFVGIGGLGFAFFTNDETRVVKFTTDISEYNFSERSLSIPNYSNNIVRIDEFSKIYISTSKANKGTSIYIILKEYAISLTNKDKENMKLLYGINNIFNDCMSRLTVITEEKIRKTEKGIGIIELTKLADDLLRKINYRDIFERIIVKSEYPSNTIETEISNAMFRYISFLKKVIEFADVIKPTPDPKMIRFTKELLRLSQEGVFFYDIKNSNIGKRDDKVGEYCIFDFGQAIF